MNQAAQESDLLVPDLPAVQQNTANAITPMQMLSMAVSQGADVDKMKQLWDLSQLWEANEARKAFVVALNKFKEDAPKIIKTKEVSFGTGKTAYKHALAGVASEQIGQALAVCGISHRWDVQQADGGLIKVTCILTHAQGHSERVSMQATPDTSGSKNSIQAIGSTVSYLQRYSLFASTGLVPKDADDDARGGSGEHVMPEGVKADFKAAIDALADKPAWEDLWTKILAASTEIGDVAAHEELRALMATKRKTLKS